MLAAAVYTTSISAEDQFKWMKDLEGDWSLSEASRQEGGTTKHKVVAPHVGTDHVAMSFSVIGNGSTIQESLMPGTAKEMATMYHCDDFAKCSKVVATHYCTKRNQPQFIATSQIAANRMDFSCDMSTSLCQSDNNHIHHISHELSNDNDHLKVEYTTFVGGLKKKISVYHFDRLER